jgi:hypothetical protein
VTIAAELLLALAEPNDAQRNVLSRFTTQTIRNVRNLDVGEMRGTAELRAALMR